MAVGTLLIALGVLAAVNLLLATIATTYIIAATMLAGAVAQLVHAAGIRRGMRPHGWVLAAALYLLAAAALLYDPMFAAAVLTLLLALLLAGAGLVRCGLALAVRPAGWGGLMASGLFSMATGILIAAGWPVDTAWILGLVLAVDLLLQGMVYFLIGFSLRAFGCRSGSAG